MIRFDTVPDVEMSTQDNVTEVFISYYDGFYEGQVYCTGDLKWTLDRAPFCRYHSGESDALGRAFRILADRVDPFGRR